jgi:hypothetical protein
MKPAASAQQGRAFVLALLLLGCHRSAPPSRFPSADDALSRMRAGQACSRAVSGEAKLDYFGDSGRVRGSLLYLALVPDRVRLDVFSPFGVTVYTVTSDGSRFGLFDLQQKTFLHGPPNACNLQRFTRVPLPPHAFAALLRGEAPVLVHEPSATSIAWQSGAYQLRIRGKNQAEETITLVPNDADWNKDWSTQRVRVLSVDVRQAGVPLYRVELTDHAPAGMSSPRVDPDGIDPPLPASGPDCHAELPRSLRFVVGDGERDLLLVNHELTHNPPLPAGVFQQSPPPGVAVRYSPCAD